MTEQLVLYPENVQAMPESGLETINDLPGTMHEAGLTGTRIGSKSSRTFKTGDAFSRLVSYLGCSPTIKNSDGSDRSFIQFVSHKPGVLFLGGKNITPPSCHRCKHKFPDWHELVQQWQKENEIIITCPECKTDKTVPELNWHYRAGFSNYEIIINGIPEGSALPANSLLELLKHHTNCKWHYLYRQV